MEPLLWQEGTVTDYPVEHPRNRGWRRYRRELILGAMVVGVVFAVSAVVPIALYVMARNTTDDPAGVRRATDPVVSAAVPAREQIADIANGFSGVLGVAATNLTTGEEFMLNADTRFPTASTIKTAVMLEAYHRQAAGLIAFTDELVLRESDKVGGSGILNGLHDGVPLTVADLLHPMIVLSDNTATNLLIGRLGTARINARLDEYGLTGMRLFRPTFRDGRPDVLPDLEREFGLGMTTPRHMAALMAAIAEGRAVSADASAAMLRTLQRQQDRQMIPRLIAPERGVQIGNKTGQDEEKHAGADGRKRHVRADAAIVTTPSGTYVVAICARQVEDDRWTVENDALVAGARISRIIYDHFTKR
jgi:beta-lactamase class A